MISFKHFYQAVLLMFPLAFSGSAFAVSSTDTATLLERGLNNATAGPDRDAEIGGAVTYLYEPHLHYKVFCKPLHVTDIQLEPGETLTGEVAAGDTARWQVAVSYSGAGADTITHLQIKPAKAGLSTNFVVTTDRRSYALLVESSKTAFMPLVKFRYSNGFFADTGQTPPKPARSPRGFEINALTFDYTFRAKRRQERWAPSAVFHDGEKTYLTFTDLKKTEAPVVYRLKDKKETLVNYRVEGNVYVIDQVLDHIVLKQSPKDKIRIKRAPQKR